MDSGSLAEKHLKLVSVARQVECIPTVLNNFDLDKDNFNVFELSGVSEMSVQSMEIAMQRQLNDNDLSLLNAGYHGGDQKPLVLWTHSAADNRLVIVCAPRLKDNRLFGKKTIFMRIYALIIRVSEFAIKEGNKIGVVSEKTCFIKGPLTVIPKRQKLTQKISLFTDGKSTQTVEVSLTDKNEIFKSFYGMSRWETDIKKETNDRPSLSVCKDIKINRFHGKLI